MPRNRAIGCSGGTQHRPWREGPRSVKAQAETNLIGSERTEISVGRFPFWLVIGASKFYDWRQRYGRVNEHNGWIPRDFWLERVGESCDYPVPWGASAGGISAAGLHDAGCRCGGREPGQRFATYWLATYSENDFPLRSSSGSKGDSGLTDSELKTNASPR